MKKTVVSFVQIVLVSLLMTNLCEGQGTCTCRHKRYLEAELFCLDSDVACEQGYACPCGKYDEPTCPLSTSIECVPIVRQLRNLCNCYVQDGICSHSPNADPRCSYPEEVCSCSINPLNDNTKRCIDGLNSFQYLCVQVRYPSSGSSTGDPHLTGFDKSRFDFHGENNRFYLIFGGENEDILTAQVRATSELYFGVNKTYFEQVAIMTTNNRNLRFYMSKKGTQAYKLKIVENGRSLDTSKPYGHIRVSKSMEDNSISVKTRRTTFRIKMVSAKSKFRHHLDVHISRNSHYSSRGDSHFTGVLGSTLSNTSQAARLQQIIRTGVQRRKLEMEMRKLFEVDSLFPNKQKIDTIYKRSYV